MGYEDGRCMNIKMLIDQAVSLPVEQRAIMADLLLRSLNQQESEVEREWQSLAQRRLAEMRTGAVEAIPGEVVFNKIWNRFEK